MAGEPTLPPSDFSNDVGYNYHPFLCGRHIGILLLIGFWKVSWPFLGQSPFEGKAKVGGLFISAYVITKDIKDLKAGRCKTFITILQKKK